MNGQLWSHMNGQYCATVGHKFPIVASIVHIWVATGLNLRAADHETMDLRDKAKSRDARNAYFDCIRAATGSISALLIQLLAIITIIWTIIAIIRKHQAAIWIDIYCANQARTSQQSLSVGHDQFSLFHGSFILSASAE